MRTCGTSIHALATMTLVGHAPRSEVLHQNEVVRRVSLAVGACPFASASKHVHARARRAIQSMRVFGSIVGHRCSQHCTALLQPRAMLSKNEAFRLLAGARDTRLLRRRIMRWLAVQQRDQPCRHGRHMSPREGLQPAVVALLLLPQKSRRRTQPHAAIATDNLHATPMERETLLAVSSSQAGLPGSFQVKMEVQAATLRAHARRVR